MRDWDRNGKIDARDRYLFHEVILKGDDEEEDTNNFVASRYHNTAPKDTTPKEKKEPTVFEIIFKVIFGVLVVIGLFVA